MIEVSRVKDLNPPNLFLAFCIGAIGRRDFAVFPVQGQRGLRRLKRYFGDKMSVGAQMVVVSKHSSNVRRRSSWLNPSNFPGSMYPKHVYFTVLLLLAGASPALPAGSFIL